MNPKAVSLCVFTAVCVHLVVFWVFKPYGCLGIYRRFEGTCLNMFLKILVTKINNTSCQIPKTTTLILKILSNFNLRSRKMFCGDPYSIQSARM
jgi:hypothetical protein